MGDRLAPILARKAREVARRRAHPTACPSHIDAAVDLRKRGPLPRVIAEVKFKSPSEGTIRAWQPGEAVRIARAYVAAGALAVSVLCDRHDFGGSILELRRVARAIDAPVLFKEFVIDETQIDLAAIAGARLVLLLVRALSFQRLHALVEHSLALGIVPVVEAANGDEVDAALATPAEIIGVNARDLGTLRIDPARAEDAIQKVPPERIAVYMSGVTSSQELLTVAQGRADAVLMGTALMRAAEPGLALARILEGAARG